jgi:ribosomal protein S18 acetylase RimI-like enzyme
MAPLTTRRAEKEDLPALATLFDAYRQFYQMPPAPEPARAYLQARLEKAESVIFVAADSSGDLLGFCQLYPTFCSVFMAPIYVLYDLFVTPAARRSGAAQTLLTAAEAHAANTGAIRLTLRTAKTNQPAQTLYERSGWHRDEIFHTYVKKVTPQPTR